MAHHPHRNQVVGAGRLGPQQVFPQTQYNNNQNFNNNSNGSHFPSQDQYFGNFPNSSPNYWGNGHVEYNQFQQQPQSLVNDFLPREIQFPQAPILTSPAGQSLVETKYVVKRNGPLGSTGQSTAAATFFAKSQQISQQNKCDDFVTNRQMNQQHGRMKKGESVDENNSSEEREQFPTNFRALVHRSPPPIPGQLLKRLEEVVQCSGKIKIFLRVTQSASFDIEDESNRFFFVDRRKKQVTLYDPSKGGSCDVTVEERGVGVAAPKMYAFDGVFTSDDSQEDVCSASLCDVISSVVATGTDGCVFCYGHANTGKSHTMVGKDSRSIDMGVIPVAIAWLYRAVKERKTKTGARFSVRVSAMEITSKLEEPRDLLATFSSPEDNDRSPAYYLRGGSSDWVQNQTELRASSADRAAYLFDAALSKRSADARGRESHLLFTMHVYQYSVDGKKGGLTGGRSRLHLIDFGGCERTKLPGGGITLSGLGNVILGIFNGQKHLPHRESTVTKILKDCLGSSACQAAIIAHVSPEPAHYSETLHTVQLASRLHRMKRRKQKRGSSSSSSSRSRRTGSGSGQSSSDFTGTGTSTNASSSEFSCDTVVYRGGHSDGSGTDGEHPPTLIGSRAGGSLDHIPVRRPRSSKILTNGAISPRNCLSPIQRTRPGSSLSGGLPSIPEVVLGGKMPLSGLVPIQSSHRVRQQQQQQLQGSGHFSNYPQHTVQQKIERDMSLIPQQPKTQFIHSPQEQIHHLQIQQQLLQQQQLQEQQLYQQQQQQLYQQQQQQQQHQIQQEQHQHQIQQHSLKQKRTYGFMDEHKVNMIHSWVENTSNEQDTGNPDGTVFRVLTQFKTADSDESSSEHKVVQVHCSEEGSHANPTEINDELLMPKKKQPPPPPPRRTPPRETKDTVDGELSHVVNCEEKIVPLDCENTNEVTDSNCELVATTDMSCQVSEEEICRSTGFHVYHDESAEFGSDRHPLRILSEENLTVVSSFAGSVQKLDEDGDGDFELEDPSRLSFFGVPDFSQIDQHSNWNCNGEDIISKKFQLLAQMQKQSEQRNAAEDLYNNPDLSKNECKEILLTFPRNPVKSRHETPADEIPKPEIAMTSTPDQDFEAMTPQKNFFLLSQSLRHPDGSSNPELNIQPENKTQRSPGNGRSGSEDDLNRDNDCQHNNNFELQQDEDDELDVKEPEPSRSKRFGLRFLKIFSSTRQKSSSNSKTEEIKRSKSCDRKLEENQKNSEKISNSKKQSRSSSSSPALKSSNKLSIFKNGGQKNQPQTNVQLQQQQSVMFALQQQQQHVAPMIETPSNMSLSTEWEFCNSDLPHQKAERKTHRSIHTNFDHIIIKSGSGRVAPMSTNKRNGDRKSSGYDSLGGDESSSLDSSQDSHQSPQLPKQPAMSCISENDTESMVGGEIVYINQNHNNLNNVNNNFNSNSRNNNNSFESSGGSSDLGIVQYEEVDILRMDQQRGWRLFHPQPSATVDKKSFSSFN